MKKFKKNFSIFNPIYIETKSLYESLVSVSNKISGLTLDVGCGEKPYEDIFLKSKKYVGIDHIKSKNYSKNKADIYFDGKKIPFNSKTFDSVVCTQVLEHVENVDLLVSEINRVLKKNGIFLISVPFFWEEHESPYDFRRFSKFGITNFLKSKGFSIIYYKKSTNSILTILQMNNNLLNSKISKFFLFNLFLKSMIFFNNLLAVLFWNFKDNNLFYINNVVIAKKK
ncbi:MAG: methyltransferase domain-containing protein [Candidatus ainarchaeum sp.]|nr:methyltransferase domain-containing protein [Candidatus ainarchaeum sp.]